MRDMPGLSTCLAPVPPVNNAFVNFLYTSGTIEKSIKAAVTDLDYRLFNQPYFGGPANSHSIQMLKTNYGPNIVVGTYTTYDLSLTPSQVQYEWLDITEHSFQTFARVGEKFYDLPGAPK